MAGAQASIHQVLTALCGTHQELQGIWNKLMKWNEGFSRQRRGWVEDLQGEARQSLEVRG